jgi:hypothetical protein
MSSISRARSEANASVDAGPPTTSGADTARDQPCQREPAVEFAEIRRNVQRRHAAVWPGLFGERQFVFIDVAERDDARQHHRVGLQLIEEDFPRHASGAPGRQIERRLRQGSGVRAGLKSIDQPAIDQRGNDATQKRHRYWNAENAHGLPDSRSGCIMAWA